MPRRLLNNLLENLEQVWARVQNYLETELWAVCFELAVIWVVVYLILRFLRGTRGARVIKGVAIILIIGTLSIQIVGGADQLERLSFLYSGFLGFISFALVIVFQPEIRRALVRLGEARFFRQAGLRKARVVEELLGSIQYLSRNKVGALIAIERQVGLGGIVEAGIRVDADVTKELLNTIFWPGSALHDMGVVLRGDRIVAAGVQFPLAEGDSVEQELGSRHRAAIGLSSEVDALILVVSEETGTISVAERGTLTRHLTIEDLRRVLTKGMTEVTLDEPSAIDEEDPSSSTSSSSAKPAA
ncbi:diadenylate cyclase CdaA [Algisphaera agarilytica]|uniref:Diadenylate cyclase n=1 Tax=Algisphaera agarilytica TaxID=1385975 RepID=A0A7X0H3F0_9BACT|nr:diadenylate cyclase CdaA [Algisphaera agarilytica]MBB6428546.1 diadenylate cyclase [Algisphaera agarilytica]